MKVTFITNACCIYEAEHAGRPWQLLADPWLVPGAFGTWTHDPPLKTRPEDVVGVDFLYISHIHPDHLCPATLAHFRKSIPIVTLKDRLSLAAGVLRRLGFENILALEDGQSTTLGPFDCTIFGPWTKHPFHGDDCDVGNVVDSALLVQADGKSVLNCNDNTMTVEAARAFRGDYGRVDLAQLNFNNAGPYPACFRNLSALDKAAEAYRCIERNLKHMVDVGAALGARRVMPFAGAYKLAYGKEHLNEFLGTTTAAGAASYANERGVPTVALAEGESVEL